MKLQSILSIVVGLGITLTVSAQQKTYYVPKAGTLTELIKENEANEITYLTLQGKLNAIDFRYLRDGFSKLTVLDISNASISMYAGKTALLPTVSTSIRPIVFLPMLSASRPTIPLLSGKSL